MGGASIRGTPVITGITKNRHTSTVFILIIEPVKNILKNSQNDVRHFLNRCYKEGVLTEASAIIRRFRDRYGYP